jgi:hypothetical protein
MLSTTHALIIGLLIIAIILNRRNEAKEIREHDPNDYSQIRNYLLNESSLAKAKKPIMWIHIPYEYNARNWMSFGSRSSMELNQPYLYLTVKSIIKNCDQDFYICLIDDNSFAKILPDWDIDMSRISDPILAHIRQMALTKLIYYYGGMITPIDFLCFRNLNELYRRGTSGNKMFVCENLDSNITSTTHDFYPDIRFMGAQKNCDIVRQMIDFMQRTISHDFTDQSSFLGEFNRWANAKINQGQIRLIDGKEVGIKTLDDEQILVDNLLNEDYINLYSKAYGVWIPSSSIMKRTSYEWFVRLSPQQVLQSSIILSKYILLALTPDSKNGVIEPLVNNEVPNDADAVDDAKFVGFWKVPSGAPLWGLKPNFLGNNLTKENY